MPENKIGQSSRSEFALQKSRSFRDSRSGTELTNDKKTLAALRNEARSVNYEGVHRVPEPIEREKGSMKIATTIRCQESRNIFQKNQRRTPEPHFFKNPNKPPERR